MIKVAIGDMFKSDAQTIVNTVNCVGVMGKGIAAEFKKRFPAMYEQYKKQCDAGLIHLGKLTVYRDLFGEKIIVNFPTKKHWKSPTLLKDIENGLDYFLAHHKKWGVTSVAFPPLGCGSGGLRWESVGPLMYEKLVDLDIPVEMYAPFGTPAKELTAEFLQEHRGSAKKKGSWIRGTLTPGEITVLEVLYRLQNERYAKPIGRTMYQKACYILSQAGVDTGFIFEKGSYGPFSSEAAKALSIFANNNLTQEEHVGNMFRLTISDHYQQIRPQYALVLEANRKSIDKAVDLLSRIKDTLQGEEVATVIYAANIVALGNREHVNSNDVMKYVLHWKKRWGTEAGKEASVKETIDDLAMLNWVDLSPTQT